MTTSRGKSRVRTASLLVEIGTEELPPTSLFQLGETFATGLANSLAAQGLTDQTPTWFATPRRLAVHVPAVLRQQPDSMTERRGPALSAAFDDNGHSTQAAKGFARSCGVGVNELQQLETDAGAWLVFHTKKCGQSAAALIPDCIKAALAALPISKRMRWGESDAEFVRPVHWLVVLHGKAVVRCCIFGIASGTFSHGHRFLSEQHVRITSADRYVEDLKKIGFIIPDFVERRDIIHRQIQALAHKTGGKPVVDPELLDTVTGLVEWPQALIGSFNPTFLEIPSEVLISSMRDHQKYFHVVDAEGALLPAFIAVSNIVSQRPARVQSGNERVLQARLADARFFWEEDRRLPPETRVENLKGVLFHRDLGSMYDKTRRLEQLAKAIAKALGWDPSRAGRAAYLCKTDLLTQMVEEFPGLQGTMGRHYARENGELKEVALALEEHYLPRYAGDALPTTRAGKIIALADRIDTLTGVFSTGEEPTGDKDPYALRRAALGIIRILVEKKLALDLAHLVELAASAYSASGCPIGGKARTRTVRFIIERYRAYYATTGFANDEINAVLEVGATQPLDFDRRLRAVSRFRQDRAAHGLAEANKRIRNILRKAGQRVPLEINSTLFEHGAEESLAAVLVKVSAAVSPLIKRGDYTRALQQLGQLHEPVDQFFADVMVLSDDPAIRANRLALLNQLGNLFLAIADISMLQSAE